MIQYYPVAFQLFLTRVNKLRIGEILNVQNAIGETCLHAVCKNGTTESISTFVPEMIRLGMSRLIRVMKESEISLFLRRREPEPS